MHNFSVLLYGFCSTLNYIYLFRFIISCVPPFRTCHGYNCSIQNGDFISIYTDCSWTNSFVVSKRLYTLPLDADVEIGRGFNVSFGTHSVTHKWCRNCPSRVYLWFYIRNSLLYFGQKLQPAIFIYVTLIYYNYIFFFEKSSFNQRITRIILIMHYYYIMQVIYNIWSG